MWPGRPSSEAPPHLALREERAGAGGLLHADSLGRALELVLAPVRAEEVAALLVLTARHALAALDAHAADGVVRLPRNLLPLARIHRRPPGSPVFGCATEAPPRLGCRARCAIGFLPWVRAFPPRVAVRYRLPGTSGHTARVGNDLRRTRPGGRLGRILLLRAQVGLRPQQEPGSEQQRTGGLRGEEQASHAGRDVQRRRQSVRRGRSPGRPDASQGAANRATERPAPHPGGPGTWPNSSAT